MSSTTEKSIARLAESLTSENLKLVTAESCTGGLVAAALTCVAGSSEWFEGGFVTYQLSAKKKFLGVQPATLERWGAVSEPTAREMAEGALDHSSADLSVAITGIAGPSGGDVTSPTGTVWIAWARRSDDMVHAAQYRFLGDRAAVRELALEKAIWGLLRLVDDELPGNSSRYAA